MFLCGRHAATYDAAHLTFGINHETAAHAGLKLCVYFKTRKRQHTDVSVRRIYSFNDASRRRCFIIQFDVLNLAFAINM